jgi:hypothetical protein
MRSLRGVPRALKRAPGFGHLCRAKACCLACWRGNLPDYDILVKCGFARQAACRKCSGDGKRSVSLSNPLQKTTSQLYRAATRVSKPNASVPLRAGVCVFMSQHLSAVFLNNPLPPLCLRAFVVYLLPLNSRKPSHHQGTKTQRRNRFGNQNSMPANQAIIRRPPRSSATSRG